MSRFRSAFDTAIDGGTVRAAPARFAVTATVKAVPGAKPKPWKIKRWLTKRRYEISA